MKIQFNKDIKLNITKGKRYQTFGYYTDWFTPGVWHKHFLFQDDNLMPSFVNASYEENKIDIIAEPFPFETSIEKVTDFTCVMPENINWGKRISIEGWDLNWQDLRNRDIWAVTQFVSEANRLGFIVNPELQEISDSEQIKIAYVKGIVKGIFETICNYFAGCANSTYSFQFIKIENRIDSTLKPIHDYKEKIFENYYKHLVEYSDFGQFLTNNNDGFYSDESKRYCLKRSITEIALTIDAIMNDKVDLKVFEQELAYPWEYSLIFQSASETYQLYLGNMD